MVAVLKKIPVMSMIDPMLIQTPLVTYQTIRCLSLRITMMTMNPASVCQKRKRHKRNSYRSFLTVDIIKLPSKINLA